MQSAEFTVLKDEFETASKRFAQTDDLNERVEILYELRLTLAEMNSVLQELMAVIRVQGHRTFVNKRGTFARDDLEQYSVPRDPKQKSNPESSDYYPGRVPLPWDALTNKRM